MTGMADQHNFASRLELPVCLDMDLGDKRAGGIKIEKRAALGLGGNGFRHAVCREYHLGALGCFVQFIDEYRAQALEALHDEAVMNDFMPHIDRWAVFLQREFNDTDRPIHARAETSRRGQHNGQLRLNAGVGSILRTSHESPAWLQSRAAGPGLEKGRRRAKSQALRLQQTANQPRCNGTLQALIAHHAEYNPSPAGACRSSVSFILLHNLEKAGLLPRHYECSRRGSRDAVQARHGARSIKRSLHSQGCERGGELQL